MLAPQFLARERHHVSVYQYKVAEAVGCASECSRQACFCFTVEALYGDAAAHGSEPISGHKTRARDHHRVLALGHGVGVGPASRLRPRDTADCEMLAARCERLSAL
eukprot:scaffold22622_cov137-Isochrysis_galbana.AAC.2